MASGFLRSTVGPPTLNHPKPLQVYGDSGFSADAPECFPSGVLRTQYDSFQEIGTSSLDWGMLPKP